MGSKEDWEFVKDKSKKTVHEDAPLARCLRELRARCDRMLDLLDGVATNQRLLLKALGREASN